MEESTAIAATWAEGVLSMVRHGDDTGGLAALTEASLSARGLAPPSDSLRHLRCDHGAAVVSYALTPASPGHSSGSIVYERLDARAPGLVARRHGIFM